MAVLPLPSLSSKPSLLLLSLLTVIVRYSTTSANGFVCPAWTASTPARKFCHGSAPACFQTNHRGTRDRTIPDNTRGVVDTTKKRAATYAMEPGPHQPESTSAICIEPRALLDRRTVAMAMAGAATLPSHAAAQESPTETEARVDALPLEYVPTLGAYVVRYSLFGEAFAAIVDTGSPFLTVPYYCIQPYRNQKMFWGCYKPELTRESGYSNTIEGFDNNYGTVVWRKAEFSFSPTAAGTVVTEGTVASTSDVVFGVLDRDLLNGSGGVFFGLIKETDRWIRPSFLGQTGYKSFCVDLRHVNGQNSRSSSDITTIDASRPKQTYQSPAQDGLSRSPRLILSKESMIGTGRWRGTSLPIPDEETIAESKNCIQLVRDLKTKYGAPVVHYTAKATKLVVNGLPLLISPKKPLYVIFDTGVSGMVVSQELFDGRYLQARKNKEKSLWGTVAVSFATQSGTEVTLRAKKPLTTPLGKAIPWKGFRGNLIAVGLAFLDGIALTVDVDDGKILFSED